MEGVGPEQTFPRSRTAAQLKLDIPGDIAQWLSTCLASKRPKQGREIGWRVGAGHGGAYLVSPAELKGRHWRTRSSRSFPAT